MAEENSESTTPSKLLDELQRLGQEFDADHAGEGYAELTKEEYLERHYWTLQYYFDDLLKEDKAMATTFLLWAADAFAQRERNNNDITPGDSQDTSPGV